MLSVRKHIQKRSQDHKELLTNPSRVALSLSSYLDLNDLHSLSLTCRNIHSSLVQYALRLKSNSLRCAFDNRPLLSDLLATQIDLESPASDPQDQTADTNVTVPSTISFQTLYALHTSRSSGWTGTKICACARDLVAECRKCGTVVCRNCTSKAPSDRFLRERYRRLCQKCLRAPLSAHLQPLQQVDEISLSDTPPISGASSVRSARSESGSSTETFLDDTDHMDSAPEAFTSPAFLRDPCTCPTRGVYLCLQCGHNLRANDTTYRRVWTWRSRYSTHIGGGLGTGLGSGDQGQKCGRGDQCLETGGSSVSWVEIDCSEGHGTGDGSDELTNSSRAGTPISDSMGSGTTANRPGYLQQEIEGIGGVVKKKVKKKVCVGATVAEFEDERKDPRKYLEREATGKERSWCGWCGRVCPSDRDQVSVS